MLTLLYTLNSVGNVKIIQDDTNLMYWLEIAIFLCHSMQNLKHHQSFQVKTKEIKMYRFIKTTDL